MKERKERAVAAGRALGLCRAVAEVRGQGLEELLEGLKLCSGEEVCGILGGGYTLCALPLGPNVTLSMRGAEVRFRGRRVHQHRHACSGGLPTAEACGIYDAGNRTVWVKQFCSVNRYNYRPLSWSVQQHLLSSHFRSEELARTEDFVVRLLPRHPFTPEGFDALYREQFSRAKAILAEPCSPGQPVYLLYPLPYLRRLKLRFRLCAVGDILCTADGEKVLGSEEIKKQFPRRGCFELSIKFKDLDRLIQFIDATSNPAFELESDLRAGTVKLERRIRPRDSRVVATRAKLLMLLQRKSLAFKEMRRLSSVQNFNR